MKMKMTSSAASVWRFATVLLVWLAFTIVITGQAPVVAQQSGAAPGPREGIEVHGHWTIEVRETDGTIVTRREFENALVVTAPELLVGLLSRQRSTGQWAVEVFGADPADNPCIASDINFPPPAPCAIFETTHSGDPIPAPWIFKALTVTTAAAGGNSTITLDGTAIAGKLGGIARVRTYLSTCADTVAPDACTVGSLNADRTLTEATVNPPISVSTGRIIQVTVDISFS